MRGLVDDGAAGGASPLTDGLSRMAARPGLRHQTNLPSLIPFPYRLG
ncbi:MAG: hypothetical protein R3B96_08985 [Pirellulaceae bacterium]